MKSWVSVETVFRIKIFAVAVCALAFTRQVNAADTPKPPPPPKALSCTAILARVATAVGEPVDLTGDPAEAIVNMGEQMGDKLVDALYRMDQNLDAQTIEAMAQDAIAVWGSDPSGNDERFEHTIRELSERGEAMKSMMGELTELHQKLATIEVDTGNHGFLGRAGAMVRRGIANIPVLGEQAERIVVNNSNVGTVFNGLRGAIRSKSDEVKAALHANQNDIFSWHEEANSHRLQARGYGAMAAKVEGEMLALQTQSSDDNAPQITALKIFARSIRDQQVLAQQAEEMKLNGIARAVIAGDVLLATRSDLQTTAPLMLQKIQMNVTTGQIMSVATSATSFTGEIVNTAARTEVELAQQMEGTVKRLVEIRDGQDWNQLIEKAKAAQDRTRKMLTDAAEKKDRERGKVIAQNQARLDTLRASVDPEVYARARTRLSGENDQELTGPQSAITVGTSGRPSRQRLTARAGETRAAALPAPEEVVSPELLGETPLADLIPQAEFAPAVPRRQRLTPKTVVPPVSADGIDENAARGSDDGVQL